MTYQLITNFDSPNYTPQNECASVWGVIRKLTAVQGAKIAIHWWGDPSTGPTFEGVINTLCTASRQASAHFVATGTGRRVACLVNLPDASWATNNANPFTFSIECDPRCRDEDYDVIAEIIAELRAEYGDLPLVPHKLYTSTQCPGNYDLGLLDALARTKKSGNNLGQATNPTPPAPVQPEWIKNLEDIADVQLAVLPAEGILLYDLTTGTPIPNTTVPRGTNVDIAKATTVKGVRYLISRYSSDKGMARGFFATGLGQLATPPVADKPDWYKNLKDITDTTMYARSETPIYNLSTGKVVRTVATNAKIDISESTTYLGQTYMIIKGTETEGNYEAVELVYLSDTPITTPDKNLDDIKEIVTKNNGMLAQILDMLKALIAKITGIFK